MPKPAVFQPQARSFQAADGVAFRSTQELLAAPEAQTSGAVFVLPRVHPSCRRAGYQYVHVAHSLRKQLVDGKLAACSAALAHRMCMFRNSIGARLHGCVRVITQMERVVDSDSLVAGSTPADTPLVGICIPGFESPRPVKPIAARKGGEQHANRRRGGFVASPAPDRPLRCPRGWCQVGRRNAAAARVGLPRAHPARNGPPCPCRCVSRQEGRAQADARNCTPREHPSPRRGEARSARCRFAFRGGDWKAVIGDM